MEGKSEQLRRWAALYPPTAMLFTPSQVPTFFNLGDEPLGELSFYSEIPLCLPKKFMSSINKTQ